MHTYCNKENVWHILPKTNKSFLPEKLQKDTISATRVLNPSYPNMFRRKESSVGISGNKIRRNNTGLPDDLKAGIENLSGFSMDNVKVHYNSYKPAKLQALAYTQGTDIHVASGQERHLPHEAWHVVQQMQGRVNPTMQINSIKINDNAALEHEADVMGRMAMRQKRSSIYPISVNNFQAEPPAQRKLVVKGIEVKKNFATTYNANNDKDGNKSKAGYNALDEYTAPDGQIYKISEVAAAASPTKTVNKIIEEFVEDQGVYYIGNKNNIVDILTSIYYKIVSNNSIPYPESGKKEDIKVYTQSIIKLAIMRMYEHENSNDVRSETQATLAAKKYSTDLINSVEDKVGTGERAADTRESVADTDEPAADTSQNESIYNLKEYQLIEETGDRSAGIRITETETQKTKKTQKAQKTYRLDTGEYTYRTMGKGELDGLLSVSRIKEGEKYEIIPGSRILKGTIGTHVGNLTQAVTYAGILVRFKMKDNFNDVILHQISSQREGSSESGKIGLKSENEGMFQGSGKKSFSFNTKETQTFLSRVDYFEVFNLGKTIGHR